MRRDAGWDAWQRGEVENYGEDRNSRKWKPKPADIDCARYTDWSGSRPSPDDYMPDFPEGTANMLCMYEDTSEGTPISPAFDTPEELAHWLADTGASAFGGMTATYEQWLATCKSGWACGAVLSSDGMESGVAAMAR